MLKMLKMLIPGTNMLLFLIGPVWAGDIGSFVRVFLKNDHQVEISRQTLREKLRIYESESGESEAPRADEAEA